MCDVRSHLFDGPALFLKTARPAADREFGFCGLPPHMREVSDATETDLTQGKIFRISCMY